ncbi:cell division protein FtsK [Streptomyces nanshensis]|uniref:Cell division protein FtsK n=2 Tax=Streptomyces nanshensis TaxID=518642 RepID=A0A1E7L316_9ACTN|nr:cell division protein FtsK [Streptomyces nanshensis]OEV10521.1 cell division protein FtsK [Streptomyces nanshensis]
MAADESGGAVLDLNKARSVRSNPTDTLDASTSTQDEGRHEESGDVALMVDPLTVTGPGLMERVRGARRNRVLPAWLRSKPELLDGVGWLIGYAGHTSLYHALRLPWYTLRLAAQAPRGFARFVGGTMRWASDAEGEAMRQTTASLGNSAVGEYLKLSRQRDRRVRWRGAVVALSLLVGLPGALALWVLAPTWLLSTAVAAVTLALGAAGMSTDKPVVSRAVVATQVERLTSTIVERAMGALGIAEVNKALGKGGEGIRFPAPITRDGPGWRADVDLPYGVTVADILDRRERLASGLRRPLGCVWPEPVPDEHAGRMVLWVGDKALNKMDKPVWPLAKSGTTSLFKPVPFGTDQRGRRIDITLMYDNMLIGAMPGMGKTFALARPLLAAALDVTAEMLVYELKGTGDLDPIGESVAADYAKGAKDETYEAALDGIRYVYRELERRADVIGSLPKDKCPENKVTPELAANRSLGLHPLVLAIDECQDLFAHGEFGKEAGNLCTAIIKRGRALGIILLLATQRPDKESLPTAISANVGTRFCLRVMGQLENDMVLGTSMYRRGIQATSFTKADKGIGYLAGALDEPQITRGYYIDSVEAERICARARKARIQAGTLTGYAAGEEPERTKGGDTLLTDILAVVPAKEAKAWSETVAERLADLRPEVYDGWGAEQLTAALKPYRIESVQIGRRVEGKVVNRRGIVRADITATVAERDGKRDAG